MAHARDLAARLPLLYGDGELVRGVLAAIAVQLEIFDEDMLETKRAHWIDAALEQGEVAMLAALLGMAPEDWQDRRLFRRWVHAVRDAMVHDGSVTVPALKRVIERYAGDFQSVTGFRPIPRLGAWTHDPAHGDHDTPAFIENPRLPRTASISSEGEGEGEGEGAGVAPLQRFDITINGLDPSPASFLLVGFERVAEAAPAIVNLTTGHAVMWLGEVPAGKRLWIRPEGQSLTAHIEGEDVSDRLRSVTGVSPGKAPAPEDARSPAEPMILQRGKNQLWFLPLLHYDAPALGRALLAMPDLDVRQGRFDATHFDRSIFFHHPAARLHVGWLETQPATFRIDLPAGLYLHPAGAGEDAVRARDQLTGALDRTVAQLRAAGVRSQVSLVPFRETQRARDSVGVPALLRLRERGSTGIGGDVLTGAVLDVTTFNDSVLE